MLFHSQLLQAHPGQECKVLKVLTVLVKYPNHSRHVSTIPTNHDLLIATLNVVATRALGFCSYLLDYASNKDTCLWYFQVHRHGERGLPLLPGLGVLVGERCVHAGI